MQKSALLAAFLLVLAALPLAAISEYTTAVVIGSPVNVRVSPSATAAVIDTFNEGQQILMKDFVGEPVTVGTLTDRWIAVKTPAGRTGFVFGAFLFPLAKLTEQPWFTSTAAGGDVLVRVTFRPDKSFLHENLPYDDARRTTRTGTWILNGRTLLLTVKALGSGSAGRVGDQISLFLYRHDQDEALTDDNSRVITGPGKSTKIYRAINPEGCSQ